MSTIVPTTAQISVAQDNFANLHKRFVECRLETEEVLAGLREGDAGICWTNEARAEWLYLEAKAELNELIDAA